MTDGRTASDQPPTTRRARELVGVALWLVVAIAWVLAMVVPWFRGGLLAHVSPLDAATFLRSGGIDAVPGAAGFGVLALPLLGVVLLGLAPVRGAAVMVARVVLWAVGTVVAIGLVVSLRDLTAGRVGWGAGLLVAGGVLGAPALLCGTVRRGDEAGGYVHGRAGGRRSPRRTPSGGRWRARPFVAPPGDT